MSADKGLVIIGKLLRKAEHTDSPDEAEALLAKAQQWATRYSIDLARARLAAADAEKRETVEERSVTLGRPGQKHLGQISLLFTRIATVNDCTVLLRGGESTVHPVGFPSDLDTVETLHRSLVAQMQREADAWLDTGEFRGRSVLARDRWGRVIEKPMHKVTARGVFYTAFVERIGARLSAARDEAIEQALREAGEAATPAEPDVGTQSGTRRAPGRELSSTALALRAKQQEVEDFLTRTYPALGRRSSRVRGRLGSGAEAAAAAGRRAADRASLRGQVGITRG